MDLCDRSKAVRGQGRHLSLAALRSLRPVTRLPNRETIGSVGRDAGNIRVNSAPRTLSRFCHDAKVLLGCACAPPLRGLIPAFPLARSQTAPGSAGGAVACRAFTGPAREAHLDNRARTPDRGKRLRA
jgi:hypothetical protein